ncbi:hypothetical protein [Streptomyces alfalfae]|uniref:Uncharacterized protein n=1 Tax=Streptomyces alfalfae TaxID=1642299 RepID=A0A7T4PHZ9_9ACTN|nr:hypothetical protein [Streptomyces alfalfae]QQC90597.1 hypothetical protein I8755_20955 [Streptomyces alfalfae]
MRAVTPAGTAARRLGGHGGSAGTAARRGDDFTRWGGDVRRARQLDGGSVTQRARRLGGGGDFTGGVAGAVASSGGAATSGEDGGARRARQLGGGGDFTRWGGDARRGQ